MKVAFLAAFLGGLLFFFSRDVQAQTYDVYYYWDGAQYQQYLPQPQYMPYYVGNDLGNDYGYQQNPAQYYDPYYQLHVMHYQLYLPQYQSYYNPAVPPVYAAPCCFVGSVVVPARRARVNPRPPGVIGAFPRAIRVR